MMWMAIGSLVFLAVAGSSGAVMLWRGGRDTGYEEGRADALAEILATQREAQKTRPRPQLDTPGPRRLHDTAPQRRTPKHAGVTPRVFAPLTDTGEMEALTNEYIHAMRHQEEQYRKSLTRGETA